MVEFDRPEPAEHVEPGRPSGLRGAARALAKFKRVYTTTFTGAFRYRRFRDFYDNYLATVQPSNLLGDLQDVMTEQDTCRALHVYHFMKDRFPEIFTGFHSHGSWRCRYYVYTNPGVNIIYVVPAIVVDGQLAIFGAWRAPNDCKLKKGSKDITRSLRVPVSQLSARGFVKLDMDEQLWPILIPDPCPTPLPHEMADLLISPPVEPPEPEILENQLDEDAERDFGNSESSPNVSRAAERAAAEEAAKPYKDEPPPPMHLG